MTSASTRRSDDRTNAVLQAALDLGLEMPYAKLSMEGIAARAGVGKHTVYRRWPSKGLVVLDAMLAMRPQLAFPDTGDIRRDLRTQMRAGMNMLSQRRLAGLYTALLGEAQHDDVLAEAFRERWLKPLVDAASERLQRAQEAGELAVEANLDIIVAMLYGPIYYQILVSSGRFDESFLDELLSAVFAGLNPS